MTGRNRGGRGGGGRGRGGRGKNKGRGDSHGSQQTSNAAPASSSAPAATTSTRKYFEKRLEEANQEVAIWRTIAKDMQAELDKKQAELDQAYLDFDKEYERLSNEENDSTENLRNELAAAKQTIGQQQGALQQMKGQNSKLVSERMQLLQANQALKMQLKQLQQQLQQQQQQQQAQQNTHQPTPVQASNTPPPTQTTSNNTSSAGGWAISAKAAEFVPASRVTMTPTSQRVQSSGKPNPQVATKKNKAKKKTVDPGTPNKAASQEKSTVSSPPRTGPSDASTRDKANSKAKKAESSPPPAVKEATMPSPKKKLQEESNKKAPKEPLGASQTTNLSEKGGSASVKPEKNGKKHEIAASSSKSEKEKPAPSNKPGKAATSTTMVTKKRLPPPVQEEYTAQTLDLQQLKEFLYPASSSAKGTAVSPVFSFFSNPDQLEIGRELVHLVKECGLRKTEYAKAIKAVEGVERSLQNEEKAFRDIENMFQKDREATEKLAYPKDLNQKQKRNLKAHQLEHKQKENYKKQQSVHKAAIEELKSKGLVDSVSLRTIKAAELALAQAKTVSILSQQGLAENPAHLDGSREELQTVTKRMANDLGQKISSQNSIVKTEKEIHETEVELVDLQEKSRFLERYKTFMHNYKNALASEKLLRQQMDKKELEKLEKSEKEKDRLERREKEKAKMEELNAKRLVRVEERKEKLAHLQKDLKSHKSELASATKAVNDITGKLERMYDKVADTLASNDLQNAIARVTDFDINKSVDERGCSLLMKAVLDSDFALARWCIDEGAGPNEMLANGMTPMIVAECFDLQRMAELLKSFGGAVGDSVKWKQVVSGRNAASSHMLDWDGTLKIAERAAVTADDLLDQAQSLENSETSRMQPIEKDELEALSLTFFDAFMDDPTNFKDSMRRRFLLEKSVLHKLQDQGADATWKRNFLDFASALQKGSSSSTFPVVRRAVVGIKNPYEVLCSALSDEKMVLYSPYITSEVDGSFDVGVLVWAICDNDSVSLNKTLIESTEFLRHKVEMTQERIHGHRNFVLRLGKDMHLLDLHSTSIYTSRPLDLFIIDADEEVGLLCDADFVPEKRVLDSDRRLANAIFQTTQKEREDGDLLVSESRTSVSTQLRGGAGTGKTLVMTKKIIEEDGTDKLLVVSRLPRLVSAVKAKVEEERDVRNVTFLTYEDLCIRLARAADPADEAEKQNFPFFSRVQFSTIVGSSSSTFQDFIEYLSARERKQMKDQRIEVATLWTAIRTIKANVKCLNSIRPLSLEEYQSLPPVFGLDKMQRSLVYQLFEAYQEWLHSKNGKKWDEADRTLYILKYGNRVFSENEFVSWYDRYMQGMGDGLVDDEGRPLAPFFFDKVFVDEAQDFSELDLALFLRMSKGARSLFLAGDPAQSVEVGLRMRASTVNDVYFSSIAEGRMNVKDVLQTLEMSTNHRTHASNLALAQAVRKVLTRSFQVPGSREVALINGPTPEALLLEKIEKLGKPELFRGANAIFLTPDENVEQLKASFHKLGLKNDVFGVREAKGLEFDSVVLFGFFSYFEHRNSASLWRNVLLWLFSETGITTTASSESIVLGKGGRGQKLEPCDYLLSHPEVEDMAMLLYTALTRARNKLYFVEVEADGIRRKRGEKGLADFAFRCLSDSKLSLVKVVTKIDEGRVEMTPQEHKARGVLYVTTAIAFARESNSSREIQAKFEEARKRFLPTFGDDKDLYDQATKHMEAAVLKVQLLDTMKKEFFNPASGAYKLSSKVPQVLEFEKKLLQFLELVSWDTFLFEDLNEVLTLVLGMLENSPYSGRLGKQCFELRRDHQYWMHQIQRG